QGRVSFRPCPTSSPEFLAIRRSEPTGETRCWAPGPACTFGCDESAGEVRAIGTLADRAAQHWILVPWRAAAQLVEKVQQERRVGRAGGALANGRPLVDDKPARRLRAHVEPRVGELF